MRIFITIPALHPPHGGLRVIIEWANRLTQWHSVILYTLKHGNPTWMEVDKKVLITSDPSLMKACDCMIITSPHTIQMSEHPDAPKKIFIFMQMLEHMFKDDDMDWNQKCFKFYHSQHPLFSISSWNIQFLVDNTMRSGPIHYIGNGVNLDHFPMSNKPKSGKIVLVEGWEGYNPAKDVEGIGPAVAGKLKAEGFIIYAYGQMRLKTNKHCLTQYFYRPDSNTLNQLYESATILIKASKFDARSCSPMEAMTKGTVTARAIIKGDDDLINDFNCLRCDYNEKELYEISKELLVNHDLRERLSLECRKYVQKYSWQLWMNRINQILIS